MKKILFFILFCTFTVACSAFIKSGNKSGFQTKDNSYYQKLARDIFKELIEINTTSKYGSTKAAEASRYQQLYYN